MRYDDEHKQRTRAKVLSAAARVIRAEGPERVGVAGVMAEAGLTHGGFYAHFANKEDLVAEAIQEMFVQARTRFDAEVGDKPPREALYAYINFYTSRSHRDRRDSGCPLPALSTDLPRLPPRAQEIFGAGVLHLTQSLATRLKALGHARARELAASVLAELVGAVALARAVADPEQSNAILKATRVALKERLGLEKPA